MRHALAALFAVAALAGGAAAQDKDAPVSYTKDVVPILKASCYECHNPKKLKGKLDMSTYALLMKGGKQKSPILPGDPDKSILIQSVIGDEPEMPEKGDKLKPEQIAILSKWIKQGAKDDTPK